jgi:hypothetical protein
MIAPMPARDDRGGVDYLGPELLTWLWWRADTDPRFEHPDGTEVFVHVDEHIEFRGERAAARRTILRSGMPGASTEARAALKSGKLVVAARLLLARGEDEIHLTLKAEDLEVSGVRLPAVDSADARERLEGNLDHLERLFSDLDLCFSTFLEVRCSDAWEAEIERIRAWGQQPARAESPQ